MNQKTNNCLSEWNAFAKGVQSKYADEERKKYSQYPGQPMDKFLAHEILLLEKPTTRFTIYNNIECRGYNFYI
jgi:hypothetical protein